VLAPLFDKVIEQCTTMPHGHHAPVWLPARGLLCQLIAHSGVCMLIAIDSVPVLPAHADNPPSLADLAWPNALASQPAKRWPGRRKYAPALPAGVQTEEGQQQTGQQEQQEQQQQQAQGVPQQAEAEGPKVEPAAPDPPAAAQQAEGQQGVVPPLQQQQENGQERQQGAMEQPTSEEEAALRALRQEAAAAGFGLARDKKLAGTVLWQQPRATLLDPVASASAAARSSPASLSSWLRHSTEVAKAAAEVLPQLRQRRAGGGLSAPLPRVYGPPPPASVGAAVRALLLTQRTVDQVVRKVLAEVTDQLLSERAAQQRRAPRGS
jgi:hypothetical protein